MSDDPFSDVLRFVSAQSVMTGGLVAGGPWAIRCQPPDKIKFFAVVKGHCWLVLDGPEPPARVEAGEAFLITAPRAFVIASDLTAAPVDAHKVFSIGAIARHGEGEEFFVIAGSVALDAVCGKLLLDVLPPVVHVRATSSRATVLQWILDQLVRERTAGLPGASVASAQLAQLMFVQVLRAHLEASAPLTAGLLRVLSDHRLAPALRLMHGDPGHSWRLEELARAAAMSRTTFSSYFKTVAGVPPLTYLTQWRMRLAERALREGNVPVSVLAHSFGYTSESAFSNAFKRVIGRAPRRYRSALQTRATAAEDDSVRGSNATPSNEKVG